MATVVSEYPVFADDQTASITCPNILCVDDDPNFVASMQRSFHPYAVNFQSAFHGMQGIMDALQQHPDIILADLQMPLASGEEMIDCLGSNPSTRATPIIVLTGRPGARLTSKLRSKGVVAVLNKPLDFEQLLSEIRRFVTVERR